MKQYALAVLFVVMSVLLRMLPHPWNFAPIIGIGLFCGAYLPKRWAIIVPVLAMALGDLMLGFVPVNLFGWVAVALTAVLGFALRRKRSPMRVVGTSLLGSALFFLISNFGVWALGCGQGWYGPNLSGLAACYAAGVPFFRTSILGDMLYTGVLFGSYELSTRWIAQRSSPTAVTVSGPR